jgi:hypothetical protein
MTNTPIENNVRFFANKYNRETDPREREMICRELGFYLNSVAEGIEFNRYVDMYNALTHPQTPVNPTRKQDGRESE